MFESHRAVSRAFGFVMPLLVLSGSTGCALYRYDQQAAAQSMMNMPRELQKSSLPEYRAEPPDVLLIEAVNSIRRPEQPLQQGETVIVRIKNGIPLEPQSDPNISQFEFNLEVQLEAQFKWVNGPYQIRPDGRIDLGPAYGSVEIAGLTIAQAEKRILEFLRADPPLGVGLKSPELSVSLQDIGGKQLISGEHLVRPDGSISLGIYGQVFVAGMTLSEIKATLEAYLAPVIIKPEISVDVMAYNSKAYYVITDGGGLGEQVVRLPYTGSETVLDAIAQINGLPDVSSKKIWIARPAPSGAGQSQILDVHWEAITAEGMTQTNYQVFPGDRIYVKADHFRKMDNMFAKMFAPVERMVGVTLLGLGLVRQIDFYDQNSFGNNNNNNFP